MMEFDVGFKPNLMLIQTDFAVSDAFHVDFQMGNGEAEEISQSELERLFKEVLK